MKEIISFETRAGLRYTINVKEDIGHALVGEVITAKRKHFVGKTLAFAKNDMLNKERLAWDEVTA
ncbi:hypothetical protein [Rhizobium sp. BK376]|uniref:hypothetical protein n=1 Tax=Rhizobium sp. BK376 TaxID=2512149 RepID=UPI0010444E73|nr:hypothetical protein [Rhizobium sp. BK376]TCR85520.1 hypothetical protein EV561_107298 [Rhizobium sp. BK376]